MIMYRSEIIFKWRSLSASVRRHVLRRKSKTPTHSQHFWLIYKIKFNFTLKHKVKATWPINVAIQVLVGNFLSFCLFALKLKFILVHWDSALTLRSLVVSGILKMITWHSHIINDYFFYNVTKDSYFKLFWAAQYLWRFWKSKPWV